MNGLLMYLVDSADMFYVSLSMQDGALYLYAHPDNELMTQVASTYTVFLSFPTFSHASKNQQNFLYII